MDLAIFRDKRTNLKFAFPKIPVSISEINDILPWYVEIELLILDHSPA
jgi:hypothetical protein